MEMDRERLASLWRNYAQGKLREEELDLLLQSLHDPVMDEAIREEIGKMLSNASDAVRVDEGVDERIHSRLMEEISLKQRQQRRRQWDKKTLLMAAALLLLVLTASWYGWMQHTATVAGSDLAGRSHMVRQVPLAQAADEVILTLGNGSRIPLGGVDDGTLAREGGASVVKRRDLLLYGAAQIPVVSPLYHKIETPRGGRYQVKLSDGTRVWLNAASGIRFPVRFSDDVREVELTGQAYFEVAHEKSRPFIVKVGDASVEVFGTHFDVMGYQDDSEIRTTLLEGSVGFRSRKNLTILKPGQQSKALHGSSAVRIREGLDVQEVIGWRTGRLHFEGEDIGQVCRALSRAFDVRLEYDERIRESFYASFPDEGRIDVVLKALEMTGKVKFEKSGDAWRVIPH
jgi:ferric-dicitrate binding protein FerR (iron transport regulator)